MYSLNARDHFNIALQAPFLMTSTTKQMRPNGKGGGGSIRSTLVAFYRHQGGYAFISVSKIVCLLAGLCKNFSTDFHKIRWKGGTWATDEDFDGNLYHVT